MASPYTKGALNAAQLLGDAFTQGGLKVGAVEVGDAVTGVTISHGLSGTPTFALAMNLGFTGQATNGTIGATASATEVRFSWTDTDAATTSSFSYIVGILA